MRENLTCFCDVQRWHFVLFSRQNTLRTSPTFWTKSVATGMKYS